MIPSVQYFNEEVEEEEDKNEEEEEEEGEENIMTSNCCHHWSMWEQHPLSLLLLLPTLSIMLCGRDLLTLTTRPFPKLALK